MDPNRRRSASASFVHRLTSLFGGRSREQTTPAEEALAATDKPAKRHRSRRGQRERVFSLVPDYYPTSSYWRWNDRRPL